MMKITDTVENPLMKKSLKLSDRLEDLSTEAEGAQERLDKNQLVEQGVVDDKLKELETVENPIMVKVQADAPHPGLLLPPPVRTG